MKPEHFKNVYGINITNKIQVMLTAEELESLHDRITKLYNENYEKIQSEINHD